MLDLVPLAGPWRIMTDCHVQSRLIRPTLKFQLPQPKAITITAAAVGTNQHTLCPSIKGVTHLSPPTTNALHCETRCVMRAAHGHPTHIMLLVVDATRHRFGGVRVGEIMHVHPNR